MISLPVAAVLFHQSGKGKKIDGTFKQMQTITVLRRDTERKPFITSVGFTYEVRADTPKGGIPGFVVSIQTNEYHIVIGQAFIDSASLEAVVD